MLLRDEMVALTWFRPIVEMQHMSEDKSKLCGVTAHSRRWMNGYMSQIPQIIHRIINALEGYQLPRCIWPGFWNVYVMATTIAIFVNHIIGHGLRPIPLSHWVAPDVQTILRGEGWLESNCVFKGTDVIWISLELADHGRHSRSPCWQSWSY